MDIGPANKLTYAAYFANYFCPRRISDTQSVDSDDLEQKFTASLVTVLQYLRKDLAKKSRSFKIGVSTIFLVVAFITMLKAAVDVAPVAFLSTA